MHGRLREDGIPSMIVYSIVLRISRFSCLFFLGIAVSNKAQSVVPDCRVWQPGKHLYIQPISIKHTHSKCQVDSPRKGNGTKQCLGGSGTLATGGSKK